LLRSDKKGGRSLAKRGRQPRVSEVRGLAHHGVGLSVCLFVSVSVFFTKSSKGLMCPGVSNPHSRGASGPLFVVVSVVIFLLTKSFRGLMCPGVSKPHSRV
jgi:hypothetical protein